MMKFPQKKTSIFKKIKNWLHYIKVYKFEIPINEFFRGISNLYKWKTIIWSDNNWGYCSFVNIMRFKLNDLLLTFGKYREQPDAIKYIKLCIKLIDKIWPQMDGGISYKFEYTNYHESEVSFVELDNDYYRMVSTELSNNLKEYFESNKKMHVKAIDYIMQNNGNNTELSQAITISRLKHEKAKKLLFNILASKIETFFD